MLALTGVSDAAGFDVFKNVATKSYVIALSKSVGLCSVVTSSFISYLSTRESNSCEDYLQLSKRNVLKQITQEKVHIQLSPILEFASRTLVIPQVLDVKPPSLDDLPDGARICAYWSQQFRCLYPGTVSCDSPNPSADPQLVTVEFDDGDSGRIPISHIRLLPPDFPCQEG